MFDRQALFQMADGLVAVDQRPLALADDRIRANETTRDPLRDAPRRHAALRREFGFPKQQQDLNPQPLGKTTTFSGSKGQKLAFVWGLPPVGSQGAWEGPARGVSLLNGSALATFGWAAR